MWSREVCPGCGGFSIGCTCDCTCGDGASGGDRASDGHAGGAEASGGSVETWWDAEALTAHVLLRDVNVSTGATALLTLPRTTAAGGGSGSGSAVGLCSPFAGVQKRVAAVRQMIDAERAATAASRALNELEETATRMADQPATAAAELAAYPEKVAAAVRLHVEASARGEPGAPSRALAALMSAWLG